MWSFLDLFTKLVKLIKPKRQFDVLLGRLCTVSDESLPAPIVQTVYHCLTPAEESAYRFPGNIQRIFGGFSAVWHGKYLQSDDTTNTRIQICVGNLVV